MSIVLYADILLTVTTFFTFFSVSFKWRPENLLFQRNWVETINLPAPLGLQWSPPTSSPFSVNVSHWSDILKLQNTKSRAPWWSSWSFCAFSRTRKTPRTIPLGPQFITENLHPFQQAWQSFVSAWRIINRFLHCLIFVPIRQFIWTLTLGTYFLIPHWQWVHDPTGLISSGVKMNQYSFLSVGFTSFSIMSLQYFPVLSISLLPQLYLPIFHALVFFALVSLFLDTNTLFFSSVCKTLFQTCLDLEWSP